MADVTNSANVTIGSKYAQTMLYLTVSVSFDNSNFIIMQGSTTVFIGGLPYQSQNANLEFNDLPLVRGGIMLSGTSFEVRSDITKTSPTGSAADPPIITYNILFEAGSDLLWQGTFKDPPKSISSNFITNINVL